MAESESARGRSTAGGWGLAILVGIAGFLVNGAALSLGWGLDLVFGGAVVFAFIRVLTKGQLVLASCISAAQTFVLWGHPWAWVIWTIEAVVIALSPRDRSPVRTDLLFWALAGVPLLAITYWGLMDMDWLSLRLVMLKQSLNGLLNVALAEVAYIVALVCWPGPARKRLPHVSLDAVIFSILMPVVALPSIVFMRFDAADHEARIERLACARLMEQLATLNAQVSENIKGQTGDVRDIVKLATDVEMEEEDRVEVYIVGRDEALAVGGAPAPTGSLRAALLAARPDTPPVPFEEHSPGSPAMSRQRDLMFIGAQSISGMPGFKAVGVAHAKDEILVQREVQAYLLSMLAGMIIALGAGAAFLTNVSRRAISGVARMAADLAMLGGARSDIRRLIVAEAAEIVGNLSQAGTTMRQERLALLANRRRLLSIGRHAPFVVYAIEIEEGRLGELSFVSPTAEAVLGFSPAELTGIDQWLSNIHPEDRDAYVAAHGALAPGVFFAREYRMRHKDGRHLWFLDSVSVERNEEDGACEMVGVLIDVTDRKRAAEERIQLSKMESLGRMAGGVAHELNQPLNLIRLASYNLLKALDADEARQANWKPKLERIIGQAERAASIVGQIRIFGRSAPNPVAVVPLQRVIDHMKPLVDWQLRDAEIDWVLAEADPDIAVRGDPIRLSQVLVNLVLNARDAIVARRAGGDETQGRISLGISTVDGSVTICVEDNGTGIPASQLPLLFEPFFTTKPPQEGTGLGLSVSYGIIADAGGALRAESTDEGARFTISLPRAFPDIG